MDNYRKVILFSYKYMNKKQNVVIKPTKSRLE